MNLDLHKYEENIKKTGFPLEFCVSETLRKGKWSVINNKYYIDDQSSQVREIDIVAYKAKKIQDFYVFTTLIISCKKNEENLWALLSKNIDKKDPNTDWKPVHIRTEKPALKFMLSKDDWKNNYYNYVTERGVEKAICLPEFNIFAFQQMNIKNGNPQNDKPIFDSVTSLMKAQAYELSKREKHNCVYQYNLISIIDSELIRLHFEEDNITGYQIEQCHYIGRYILNQEETFARIHFMKKASFANILCDYDLYHEANCSFFEKIYDGFYIDVVKDYEKRGLFKEELSQKIKWIIYSKVKNIHERMEDLKEISLHWDNKQEILEIGMNINEEEANILNSSSDTIEAMKKLLNNIYRYKGDFKFTKFADFDDLSF
jgi:hypothetical protein